MYEYDRYVLAKSLLDLQEYDRAAHFTKSCTSAKAFFVHVYSRYLAGEKRKVDDAIDTVGMWQSCFLSAGNMQRCNDFACLLSSPVGM